LFSNPLGSRPAAGAAAANVDDELRAASACDAYRGWCAGLLATALAVDLLLAVGLHLRVDPTGAGTIAWIIGAMLAVSRLLWPEREHPRTADCLGVLAFMWLATLACGTMATIGLRLGMPVADRALFAVDRGAGIDSIGIASFLADQPARFVSAMADSYNLTMPVLGIGLLVLAALGRRLEAWRAIFCYVGTLWSACLISIAVPAKGLGVWFPKELVARLPERSATYAFGTFEAFRNSADPLFSLDVLAGVVTFPSFHVAMGLIILAMCRKLPLLLIPAGHGFMLMICSTLPIGGHYVIDLVAGALLWACWFSLSRLLERDPHLKMARAAIVTRSRSASS
jgi:membrane-associated phospholipid phosphatase